MSMRIEDLDTPALVIDLDVLERNVRAMSDAAGEAGVRLRPHTKTHKSPEIARMRAEARLHEILKASIGKDLGG